VLDLAILGLLEGQDLHGYEIRRQLREHLGLLANVSFGSLYPALARLEAAGAVEATDEGGSAGDRRAPAVPPTGSLSGEWAALRARRHTPRARRSRKVYRITPVGRALFAELLAGSGVDDARTFGLRLAFARHLAPQARLGLLERRRAQLAERLLQFQRAEGDPELDVYARSLVEHTAEGVAQDIDWLDRLIEVERYGGTTRPEPAAAEHELVPGRRTAADGDPLSRHGGRRTTT
jgi:DNA-binding PadR family transcriptional regulator